MARQRTASGGPTATARRHTAVSAGIRDGARFDGVIDLARAVASPTDTQRINRAFDLADHLHLHDARYTAVASRSRSTTPTRRRRRARSSPEPQMP